MIPLPKNDSNMLDYWVADMQRDPAVQSVVNSAPFGRLKRISFLGALDHIGPTRGFKKTPRTRAHHSLYVAALANYVATQRNYNDDLKRHLVVAGLLHDIGHPPLSHSVEPYLKTLFGFGHHEIGDALINGEYPISRKLHRYLNDYLNVDFITDLVSGNVSDEEGGDLFSSPVNIDTIEGIIRSSQYLSSANTALNPVFVARASFVETSEECQKLLDDFWNLKDFVYAKLVNNQIGLMADKYSQAFFIEKKEKIDELELLEDEVKWGRKYHMLFQKLGDIKSIHYAPSELRGVSVEFTKRNYFIAPGERGRMRYNCSKENSVHSFSTVINKKVDQLYLA